MYLQQKKGLASKASLEIDGALNLIQTNLQNLQIISFPIIYIHSFTYMWIRRKREIERQLVERELVKERERQKKRMKQIKIKKMKNEEKEKDRVEREIDI